MTIKKIIAATTLLTSSTAALTENHGPIDLCTFPQLPPEIQALQDKIERGLTLTPGDVGFTDQYIKYLEEKAIFESTYSKELSNIEEERKAISEKLNPSELKFSTLSAKYYSDKEILDDIKIACWQKEMGVDEYNEYHLCNTLTKEPKRHNWNNMLTCTIERSQLFEIELYRD